MYEATFACYKRIYEQANCVPYGWESTCLMLLTQPGDEGSVSDHIATIEKLRYICTKNWFALSAAKCNNPLDLIFYNINWHFLYLINLCKS